jgi:hypothetical protein
MSEMCHKETHVPQQIASSPDLRTGFDPVRPFGRLSSQPIQCIHENLTCAVLLFGGHSAGVQIEGKMRQTSANNLAFASNLEVLGHPIGRNGVGDALDGDLPDFFATYLVCA